MRRFVLTTLFALSTTPVWADDVAVLFGTDRYDGFDRVARAADVLSARDELEALGFRVETRRNGDLADLNAALTAGADRLADADRLVIALSGRFVSDGVNSWYLAADSDFPTLFGLDQGAVSLNAVLRLLAERPGQAVLLLGHNSTSEEFGPYLGEFIAPLQVPQGVTVLQGSPRSVADFLEDHLAQPRADLTPALRASDLIATGYVPQTWILMPAADQVDLSPGPVIVDPTAENAAWDSATALDTSDSYQSYLDAFPLGRRAAEARTRIEAIIAEPFRAERLIEEALTLTRDQRRDVQRDLTILDYNTRGIDGILGSGSRRAITNWQQSNGYPQTGYLTGEQINRLDAQAARKAAQLEAEAEARRQEQERLDRAYWDETGARGDAAGYRAYVDRFPDGLYAAIARQELQAIDAEILRQVEADERDAWTQVSQADVIPAYRQYLIDYPEGQFRDQAEARIGELTQSADSEAANQAAKSAEQALSLNPITARLLEARLSDLGLNPGTVDGRFDDTTRAAIRRYQEARELPVTGYFSEAVLVRLLADSLEELQ